MKDRGKRRNRVRILVNFVLIAGILGTGWKISEELIQRKQSTDFADSLWKHVAGGSAGGTEANKRREAERPSPEEQLPGPAGIDPGQAPGEAKTQDGAETPPSGKQASGPAATGHGQAPGEAKTQNGAETPPSGKQASGPVETEPGQAPGEAKTQDGAETPSPSEVPHAETLAEPEDPAVPKLIDFEPLWEISKNAKAWLFSPDTGLSQAVAQTDNNDYYLKHLLDGRFNTAGTLFIDSRNKGDFTDRNTIIYGHSMRNKSMFGRLIQYREADYCREHPFLYLYTPGHRFRLDIVATFGVRDDSAYYTIPVRWKEWETMLEKGRAKTAWDFGVSCGEKDHFVTLSTCAYEIHQERWIVIARIDDPENVLNDAE